MDDNSADRMELEAIEFRGIGDLERARVLQERVLKLRTEHLGSEHHTTLLAKNNLAETIRELGDIKTAHKMHSDVYAGFTATLGDDHADTLMSCCNLAETLRQSGNLNDARVLHERTLARRRRMLGDFHRDTLGSMNNLALTLWEAEHRKEAADLFREVVDRRLYSAGVVAQDSVDAADRVSALLDDPIGAIHVNNIPQPVYEMFPGQKVDSLYRDVLYALTNLALILEETGETEEGRILTLRVWQISRRVYGERHPQLTVAAWHAYRLMGRLGEWSEAEKIMNSDLTWLLSAPSAERLDPQQVAIRKMLAEVAPHRRKPSLWSRLIGR